MNILLVDDEPHVTKILSMSIRRKNHSVDVAMNGEQALDKMSDAKYDMVITDIEMPKMNGVDLCKNIFQKYNEDSPFIIVVSSRTDMTEFDIFSKLKKIKMIEKPLSTKKLMLAIDDVNEMIGN